MVISHRMESSAIKIILFFIFSFFSAIEPTSAQTLFYLKGTVTLIPMVDGEEQASKTLKKGAILPYGSRIKTGTDSLAVLSFPEGSKLKIDPDTLVQILEPKKEDDGSSSKTLQLIRGGILMEFVRSHPEDTIIVERDFVSLAVRGTKFFMGEEGNDLFASVEKGKVAIVNNNDLDYEDINAGESIVVESGKTLTAPTQYNWSQGINWRLGNKARQSGFFEGENRRARIKEVKQRISKLRGRKKKALKGRFQKRMKRFMKRRGQRQERIKELRQKRKKRLQKLKKKSSGQKKQRVQKFKDKLRKRKALRRRRN